MKCVGIIGAMEQEVARLKEVMENVSSVEHILLYASLVLCGTP